MASDGEVVIPTDVVGEQVLLAATLADWRGSGAGLLDRLQPDLFTEPRHRVLWGALRDMRQRRLEYDPATVLRLTGDRAAADYLAGVADARPDPPADLDFHVGNVEWDRQRVNLATGPLPSLLEALRDPAAEPDRVRALARSVGESMAGGTGSGRWLHDQTGIVREQMAEVRKRVAGHASYPYGIRGLDVDLERGARRIIPGAAPGMVTLVTGCSGSGKTTLTAHLVLGLARQGRRVLYGAWEMTGGMTLELLACLSLGMSRSALMEGARETGEHGDDGAPVMAPLLGHEELVLLEERMHLIGERVRFMRNPFRRGRGTAAKGKDWTANARNLDTLHEHLADSGCDVFVGDLFKRIFADASPEAEEEGLYRTQAMMEELRVHGILLNQQRGKDVEARADKRPTREGNKGSGAWVEIADTVLAPHRPAQWKRMDDDHLELFVLKQRYGKWPLGIEFDWVADTGNISGGRSITYDAVAVDGADVFREPDGMAPRGRRGAQTKWR
jgi:hypothetical protein